MKLDREKIYNLLNEIPKGQVSTYGDVAKKIGSKSYRGVAKIISLNPNAPKVPCHRVVKSDGSISGYAYGVKKKIELLKLEGIEVRDSKIVNFKDKLYKFYD